MTTEQVIELFRAIGLDDDAMHKWHEEFEKKYPQEHQRFLEWLNVPPDKINLIRQKASA
ncbi:MAG: hypothetical protein AB1847_06660 [bacterium]